MRRPHLVTAASPLASSNGRKMGCMPRQSRYGELDCFLPSERLRTKPRSQWVENDFSHLVWHGFDQDGIGSCTCNAAAQVAQIIREIMGLSRKVLSPGNLYGRINGGRDQGSSVDVALQAMVADGICTADVQAVNTWKPLAANWKQSGRYYKVVEFIDLNGDVDATFSAVDDGWPCIIGVEWPGGGGHAITVVGKRKASGSNWDAKIKNSWGDGWGDNGFGWLTEPTLRTMSRYGSWAARVMTSTQGV